MFNTHCRAICKVPGRFGKKTTKNTKTGGELIKHGGYAQETSSRTLWKVGWTYQKGVHLEIFLRKPLGGNHLPFSPINRQRRLSFKGPWPLCCVFRLFLAKRSEKKEGNPSLGASVTLPRRFREDFPLFFVVLRSSTGKFLNPRLSIHSCFVCFHSSSRLLSVFFSFAFNEFLTIYLSRYLAK